MRPMTKETIDMIPLVDKGDSVQQIFDKMKKKGHKKITKKSIYRVRSLRSRGKLGTAHAKRSLSQNDAKMAVVTNGAKVMSIKKRVSPNVMLRTRQYEEAVKIFNKNEKARAKQRDKEVEILTNMFNKI